MNPDSTVPETPADLAVQFFGELIDSVETLGAIVDIHGTATLADLFYLFHAIAIGGSVDGWVGSTVLEVVSRLPSATRWAEYVKQRGEDASDETSGRPPDRQSSIQSIGAQVVAPSSQASRPLEQFASDVERRLRADGYEIHHGTQADSDGLAGRFWFTWAKAGMADCEVGSTCDTALAAWSSALTHRLSNSAVPMHPLDEAAAAGPSLPMGAFHAAQRPEAAFDAEAIARQFGVSLDAAAAQVERLKSQSVFMNERYQVNVRLVRKPFGRRVGDVFWLSIKRRDRAPIHDWRELQQVKNAIVGDEHEGIELYPAESRLVDAANQYHLWVFADRSVRLPVGFTDRDVQDEAAAAAGVGARQRGFAKNG